MNATLRGEGKHRKENNPDRALLERLIRVARQGREEQAGDPGREHHGQRHTGEKQLHARENQ